MVVIRGMALGLSHFSRVLSFMVRALSELAPVRGSHSLNAFSCLSFAVIDIPTLGNHDGTLCIVAKTLIWWILSRFRRAVSS
ncbi:hypothetical protein V6N13_089133 [Hibiscus sabdariffa]